MKNGRTIVELARLFLKLGCIGFGGPAGHIALMEEEVVRRRGWLTREQFLDLIGATNLIPGPNSTELVIHIGRLQAGFAGLVVAGTCFIAPAMLLTVACAWVYVRFGALPESESVLYGIKPVIIAIVLKALWSLARTAIKTSFLGGVALAGVGLSFLGVNELVILFGAGFFVALCRSIHRQTMSGKHRMSSFFGPIAASGAAAATAVTTSAKVFGLGALFLFFLKVGSVLFGSGYVLLAFLRADLVERWQWLSETQLLDAVAVGQLTPGPVFTTATFIGYQLGSWPGAIVATLGIFLPAFFFVAVSGPLIPRLRQSAFAGAFLDGVNVASLALMGVVTLYLGRAALVDIPAWLLAATGGFLLLRYRVNAAWLVVGGGIVGFFAGA